LTFARQSVVYTDMKIHIIQYKDYCEVIIRNAQGINLHIYNYNTLAEAKSFFQGFRCCQSVINGLVQSLPLGYDFQIINNE